jgi:tetratricopeptide (TPR) repeat protein
LSQHPLGRPPRGRRWCVPPAAMRGSHTHLPGIDVLVELGGKPGLVLWLLLRDVELWGDVPASSRPTLFRDFEPFRTAAEALPAEIAGEVDTILAMLRRSDPGDGADACRNIAAWAQASAPGTALLFAQAGALLDPDSAARAHEVAQHALGCRQPLRAESWLRRAVALARRQRDWSTYALAYADLAEIHEARQATEAAQEAFQRVLRVCRRHSLPGIIRGRALAGFLRAAVREGRVEAAIRLNRGVLRAVDPADRGALPLYLSAATALAGAGRHAEVLALLRRGMRGSGTEEERFEVARLLVRSAAGGEARAREQAWEDAVALLQRDADAALFARLLGRLADDLRAAPVE